MTAKLGIEIANTHFMLDEFGCVRTKIKNASGGYDVTSKLALMDSNLERNKAVCPIFALVVWYSSVSAMLQLAHRNGFFQQFDKFTG